MEDEFAHELEEIKEAESEKEKMILKARTDADKMIAEANAQAKKIVEKAAEEAEKIGEEILAKARKDLEAKEKQIISNAAKQAGEIFAMQITSAMVKKALENVMD